VGHLLLFFAVLFITPFALRGKGGLTSKGDIKSLITYVRLYLLSTLS
jgi:hypothetical protein